MYRDVLRQAGVDTCNIVANIEVITPSGKTMKRVNCFTMPVYPNLMNASEQDYNSYLFMLAAAHIAADHCGGGMEKLVACARKVLGADFFQARLSTGKPQAATTGAGAGAGAGEQPPAAPATPPAPTQGDGATQELPGNVSITFTSSAAPHLERTPQAQAPVGTATQEQHQAAAARSGSARTATQEEPTAAAAGSGSAQAAADGKPSELEPLACTLFVGAISDLEQADDDWRELMGTGWDGRGLDADMVMYIVKELPTHLQTEFSKLLSAQVLKGYDEETHDATLHALHAQINKRRAAAEHNYDEVTKACKDALDPDCNLYKYLDTSRHDRLMRMHDILSTYVRSHPDSEVCKNYVPCDMNKACRNALEVVLDPVVVYLCATEDPLTQDVAREMAPKAPKAIAHYLAI